MTQFEETLAAASPNTNAKKVGHYLSHGGYYLCIVIWRFIFGPKRTKIPKSKDSQFKFIAEQLISTIPDNDSGIITRTTKQLLDQHRTIENTQARRRLEKWACWTIAFYLIMT